MKERRIKHPRLFGIRFFLTHGKRLKKGIDICQSVVWEDDKK